jgi:hypothetical protein
LQDKQGAALYQFFNETKFYQMNRLKKAITALLICVAINTTVQAQELLTTLPETKEQFIESEKNVLATIEWLENTPIKEDEAKHKEQYALLTAWIINSPTVNIEVNSKVLPFTKKNSELLIFFMAGWTRYCLQNNYSKDITQGSLAGIKSAIKIYKAGGLKKDKEMQKLVDLDDKGELEKWVSDQLAKK